MDYFEILFDDRNKNFVVCYFDEGFEVDQYAFESGEEFHEWNDDFFFYYHKHEGTRFTDYLVNDLGWFLVSEKLKSVLEELNVRAQYFAINIIEKESGEQITDYYVANVLDVIDALDLENSDYSVMEFEGQTIYSIRKYAVSRDRTEDKNIFRLRGDEFHLFASERFKDTIEERNITGFDFYKIRTI